MPFDAGSAFIRLSGIFQDDGFRKWSKAQDDAEARSKRPVNSQLGANVNNSGFAAFTEKVRQAGLLQAEAKLTVNERDAEAKLVKMQALLATYKHQVDERKSLNLDTAGAEVKVEILKKRIDELNRGGAVKSVTSDLRGLGIEAENVAKTIGTAGPGGAGSGGGGVGGANLLTSFGGLTGSVGTLGPAIAALSPLLVGLGGGLTAVAASASSAAIGAGVVGGGGLAALGVGLAGVASIAVPAAEGIKKVETAQTALNLAQATYGGKTAPQVVSAQGRLNAVTKVYGANSTQAQSAQKALDLATAQYGSKTAPQVTAAQAKLNAAIKQAGGQDVKNAIDTFHQITSQWTQLTATGRKDLFTVIDDALHALQRDLPFFAQLADRSMHTVETALQRPIKVIQSPEFKGILSDLERTFQVITPGLVSAGTNVALGLGHIFADAGPEVDRVVKGLDGITTDFLSWTRNSGQVHTFLHTVFGDLQSWFDLLKAVGVDVKDVFVVAEPFGRKLVDDLTGVLNSWDRWMNSANGQKDMKTFFSDSVTLVEKVFGFLGKIAGIFGSLAATAMPAFSSLLSVVNGILGAVDTLTNDLPGILKFIPALTLGAGVIAGWKAMSGYVRDIFAAGKAGAELGGIRGAAGLSTLAATGALPRGTGRALIVNGATTSEAAARQGEATARAIEMSPFALGERASGARELIGLGGGSGLGTRGIAKDLGLLKQRASTGLGIGVTGAFGSELLASLIGGKTGKSVGTIGTFASAGAGLGSLLGPEGTLAGGVIGGLVGGFKSFFGKHTDESEGKRLAQGIQKGMDSQGLRAPGFSGKKGIRDATDALAQAQKDFNDTKNKKLFIPTGYTMPSAADKRALADELAKQKQNVEEAAQRLGTETANVFNKNVKAGARYWTTTDLFGAIKKQLQALPPQARDSAAQSMLQMARRLVQDGRLPKSALGAIVTDLNHTTGLLPDKISLDGKHAMRELTLQFKMNDVVKTAQDTIDKVGKTWSDAPHLAKTNATNARKNFATEMDFLLTKIATTTGAQRDAAQRQWKKLAGDADKYSNLARTQAAIHFASMESAISGIMGAVNQVVGGALGNDGLMGQLGDALGGLGLKVPKVSIRKPKQSAANIGKFLGSAVGAITGNATGGYANPYGGPGDDHILLSPDGRPVAAMSGTEGIFNQPQMGVVDSALAFAHTFGGLPYSSKEDLWGSGMRHYATGGAIERASALAQMNLPYIWGGHHGDRGPIADPRPGLDCSSTVSYVLGIPPRVSGAFENFGAPGPGPITIYANPEHVFMSLFGKGFGTSNINNPDGGPEWLPYNSRPGFVVRHVGADFAGGMPNLTPPTLVMPNSSLKNYGQGVLDKAYKGAQGYMTSAFGTLNSTSGQPLKEFSGQPWESVLQQIAKAKGWSARDWNAVVNIESTGNPSAVNPNGGATGLGQMKGANIAKYNGTGSPDQQIVGMGNYITDRYGNPTAALAHEHAFGWYNRGGPLSGLAAGVRRLAPGGMARTATTKPKAPPKLKVPTSRITGDSIKSLTRFAGLPGIPDLTSIDALIQGFEDKYTQQDRFSTLVDGQITPADLGPLIAIRTQILNTLTGEQGSVATSQTALGALGTTTNTRMASAQSRARAVETQIANLQKQMQHEARRMAKLRHDRAGKVMNLADKLAGQLTALTGARANNTDAQRGVLDRYRPRTSALQAQIKTARSTWDSRINAASTKSAKAALRKSRDTAISRLEGSLTHETTNRDNELGRLRSEGSKISKQEAKIRQSVAGARRRYAKRGFDDAWAYQLGRWKEEDQLKRLEASNKALTGSAASYGTGGAIGAILKQQTQITAAETALKERADALPTTIGNTVLDLLELDISAGAVPSGDVQRIAQQLGLAIPSGPAPGTVGGIGGTDAAGAVTGTAADIATQAQAQLASFEQSQTDLFRQFGSNYAASPTLQAVLSAPAGGGLRNFGAAGSSIAEALGLGSGGGTPGPQFNQINHYESGPEDPHIHAQVSKNEFQQAFG